MTRERKMTLKSLRRELADLGRKYGNDMERAHSDADRLLLQYIGDEEVSKIFHSYPFWYA